MDIEGHYVRQFLLERVIGDYRIICWHLVWVKVVQICVTQMAIFR